MKKILCYILILVLLVSSCVGCKKEEESKKEQTKVEENEKSDDKTDTNETMNSDSKPEDTSATPETSTTNNTSNNNSSSEHKHNYKESVTNATCTNSGTKTYRCTSCSQTYTETIPAKGHSWINATCTSSKKCQTCGVTEGSALGHNYNNGTCTRCNYKPNFAKEYVMAAYCLDKIYKAAKFPDTLYIQKAYYTSDNGYGAASVVLVCVSQNEMGGNSLAYAYAHTPSNPVSSSIYVDNSYYLNVNVSNKDPYASYSRYHQIDIQTCYDAYDARF